MRLANGTTAANSLIKRFQQLIAPFASFFSRFSSVLSKENRVYVVGNWLDVQGIVHTNIHRRKQDNIVGESSQLRGVAWPCKCDL